jgi:hypothetical protein
MLLGCQTVYYFNAKPIKKPENELNVWFLLNTIKPNIKIDFHVNSSTQISNFELENWFFQIGDSIIKFDMNNMHFESVEVETRYFLTLFNDGRYDIESMNRWNQSRQDKYDMKTDNFRYRFYMTKYVGKQLADEIRENNISFMKAHLKFSFMIDDEKHYHTIDEDFTIIVKKGYITIFALFNPNNF